MCYSYNYLPYYSDLSFKELIEIVTSSTSLNQNKIPLHRVDSGAIYEQISKSNFIGTPPGGAIEQQRKSRLNRKIFISWKRFDQDQL